MAKTLAEILAEGKKRASRNGGLKPVKPPVGTSVWRILKGWNTAEPEMVFHQYGQHFIKGLDDQTGETVIKTVVTCPQKTFDQPCPICAKVYPAEKRAKSQGDLDLAEALDEAKAGQQYIFVAYRTDIAGDPKVEILSTGSKLFQAICEMGLEYPNLFNDDDGQDVAITRDGSGKNNTSYTAVPRSPAKSKPVPASVKAQMIDLLSFVQEGYDETRVQIAHTTLAEITGGVSRVASPALVQRQPAAQLAAPSKTAQSAAEVLDDSIPGLEEEILQQIEDVEVVETTPATKTAQKPAETFSEEDLDQDDLDKLMADLNI